MGGSPSERYRCAGDLDAPVGDCRRRPTHALLAMGVLDQDEHGVAAPSTRPVDPDEVVPVLITACRRHLPALEVWAVTLWGDIAEVLAFPVSMVDDVRVELGLDGQPCQAINPEPAAAVRVELAG